MSNLNSWGYQFKDGKNILIKNLTTNREYLASWEIINEQPAIKLHKTRLPKYLTTALKIEIIKRGWK
jgi:pectate lyase